MKSLIFLVLKWVLQSICSLALSCLLLNQHLTAEDLVPIVTPDQLNASELERFHWSPSEFDFNVQPAAVQFDLPTVLPMIPLPVQAIETTPKMLPVPENYLSVQEFENHRPFVEPEQAPPYLENDANLPPLAKYPAAKTPDATPQLLTQEEGAPLVEPNPMPGDLLPQRIELSAPRFDPPPSRQIELSSELPAPMDHELLSPQPDLNLQSDIPNLRPTKAKQLPKLNSESKEVLAERAAPPLAKYPSADTNRNSASDLTKQDLTEDQTETTAEPGVTTEPARTSQPNAASQPDLNLSGDREFTGDPEFTGEPEFTGDREFTGDPEFTGEPNLANEPELADEPELANEPELADEPNVAESNVASEPIVTSELHVANEPNETSAPELNDEPDGNDSDTNEDATESDPPSAPRLEASANSNQSSDNYDALPETKTPGQIMPTLIVPAKRPLGSAESAADVPTDLVPGRLANERADTHLPRKQTGLQDPFMDEDAPAEDYPRNGLAPEVPDGPAFDTHNTSIVPEYGGMNCVGACCFQPEYYFLIEGVFLERQGGLLTLSNNFSIDPFDYQPGGRFTYRSRPEYDSGVEISYVGLFNWNASDSRSSAAGSLSSTFVPGPGLTPANFSAFNNATFQQQRFKSSLHSVEYQNIKSNGDAAWFTAGLRYVLLQDEFQFESVNLGGQRGRFNLDTANNLLGPQVGVNLMHDFGNGLSFSLKGKLGLMANINNSQTRLDNNGFLVANQDDNVDFSALFEAGVLAHYQINPSCRLRAGYEAWLLTGMTTVEDNLGPTISQTTGSNVRGRDDVFLNGFTIGLELFY